MGVAVSCNWFDRGSLAILHEFKFKPSTHVDRCSSPLPWDTLSSPKQIMITTSITSITITIAAMIITIVINTIITTTIRITFIWPLQACLEVRPRAGHLLGPPG